MSIFHFHFDNPKPAPKEAFAWRFWLLWGLLLAGLAFGIHQYFEYRNRELDKRIERLGK